METQRFFLQLALGGALAWAAVLGGATKAEGREMPPAAVKLVKQFCVECHEGKEAESGVDLVKMSAEESLEGTFKNWQKAVAILKQGKMPPKDAEQPSDAERKELIGQIEGALRQAMDEHAGDPGAVVVRRLTSAEYGYTIQDLTGETLNLEQDFAGDGILLR